MSSQRYIVESRQEPADGGRLTAYLNQSPDADWSSQFDRELDALGAESGFFLEDDKIVLTDSSETTAEALVARVNARATDT